VTLHNPSSTPSARPLRLIAAGLALGFLAACSSSSPVTVNQPLVTTVPGATTVAPTASSPAQAGDVNQLLAAYANGYQFTTTLTIGGAVTATFQGRRFGGSTVLLVTQNGLTVDEVITAAGTWVRQQGQEWSQTAAPTTNTDPLQPLRTPKSWRLQPDGTIAAVYAAEAFGLPSGDLAVVVTAAGGALTQIQYDTTVSGKPATLATVFTGLTDTTPITAPA
jgi:hypothetical protein